MAEFIEFVRTLEKIWNFPTKCHFVAKNDAFFYGFFFTYLVVIETGKSFGSAGHAQRRWHVGIGMSFPS